MDGNLISLCITLLFTGLALCLPTERTRYETPTCYANYFPCDGWCAPNRWMCDGKRDCRDRADEAPCSREDHVTTTSTTSMLPSYGGCPSNQFLCDGWCAPLHWACDGVQDCTDGMDERSCGTGSSSTSSSTTTTTTTATSTTATEVTSSLPQSTTIDNEPLCEDDQFYCNESRTCLPNAWICDGEDDCSDGVDEMNCEPMEQSCEGDQFRCPFSRCIPNPWVCDGENDCRDGEDELNCPSSEKSCKDTEFRCNEKQLINSPVDPECIPKSWLCDGKEDCINGIDEKNCTLNKCEESQFRCSVGTCIEISWVCDGQPDCKEGEDERNCTVNVLSCKENEFQCNKNQTQNSPNIAECIPKFWVCDEDVDCSNGSDEENCPSNASTPQSSVTTTEITSTIAETTTIDIEQSCEGDQFRCQFSRCIPNPWVCDGQIDCRDGEDELNCPSNAKSCKDTEFQCNENQTINRSVDPECISKQWLCDGAKDCINGIDEQNCTLNACGEIQFRCSDGECIQKTWVCDEELDCAEGDDERNCSVTVTSCKENQFLCTKNQTQDSSNIASCIPKFWLCDGDVDCSNGSDEENCPSNDSTPQSSTTTTEITTNSGDTTIDTVISCHEGQFQCSNQTQNNFSNCIPKVWVCDGEMDCINGLDEENCTSNDNTFSTSQSSVTTTEITSNSVDTTIDTAEDSTAWILYTSCANTTFECSPANDTDSAECVPLFLVCDGYETCKNGRDEENCTVSTTPQVPRSCKDDEFQCERTNIGFEASVNQCIPKLWLCDGEEDCSNGMDESNCPLDDY